MMYELMLIREKRKKSVKWTWFTMWLINLNLKLCLFWFVLLTMALAVEVLVGVSVCVSTPSGAKETFFVCCMDVIWVLCCLWRTRTSYRKCRLRETYTNWGQDVSIGTKWKYWMQVNVMTQRVQSSGCWIATFVWFLSENDKPIHG